MAIQGMKPLDLTAAILVSVSAVNWGLVKFINFNLVDYIATLVKMPIIGSVIYGAVAISGIFVIYKLFK